MHINWYSQSLGTNRRWFCSLRILWLLWMAFTECNFGKCFKQLKLNDCEWFHVAWTWLSYFEQYFFIVPINSSSKRFRKKKPLELNYHKENLIYSKKKCQFSIILLCKTHWSRLIYLNKVVFLVLFGWNYLQRMNWLHVIFIKINHDNTTQKNCRNDVINFSFYRIEI